MSSILARVARWVANKLVVLVLIVAILVGGLWVKSEWGQIKSRLADARMHEEFAERMLEELVPLEERRAELERLSEKFSGDLANAQSLRERAQRAESLASLELQAVRDEKRWYFTKLTHAGYFARLKAAELKLAAAAKVRVAAGADFSRIQSAFAASPHGAELIRLRQELATRNQEVEALRKRAANTRIEAAQRPIEKLRAKVLAVLPSALLVLAGVVLSPLLIKALLYFGLAPLISKIRPVVVIPDAGGGLQVSESAVSVPLTLEPGDHLIVHSDFLQAAGAGPGKSSRLLFSWRMPFTSLAAGLFLMVMVRNPSQEPQKVTVAPKKELFDMLCAIRIPEGSSMVVYPRSLVGLVASAGKEPRISRHWKLASLHSWITFQFRYLVIHGPAHLIIKGCRGVRADAVEPTQPRMQDQCATLGFSANLAYSGIRCETFLDYLIGRDGLFNDRFSDGNGFHLTEEIPDPRQKTGLFGRGLEGLVDGFLKAFGI
jgi:hypothetical protein